MYETFDHTADLGLRVRTATLEGLFLESAAGLLDMMIEDTTFATITEVRDVELAAEEYSFLLVDWLRTLHLFFEIEGMIFQPVHLQIENLTLKAKVAVEPFHAEKHGRNREVKAITYHDLTVQIQPDQTWYAEFIVDI